MNKSVGIWLAAGSIAAAGYLIGQAANGQATAIQAASGLDRSFTYMSDFEAAVETAQGMTCVGGWADRDRVTMRAWASCGTLQLILLPADLGDPSIGTGADALRAFVKMVGPFAFAERNWAVIFQDEASARQFQQATGLTPLT